MVDLHQTGNGHIQAVMNNLSLRF